MPTTTTLPNPHLADPALHPFTTQTFSPIDYLNTTLPKPTTSTTTLSTTASQTQTHISTLAAQTTRLSDTLTTLTDDILRTSSRLAYEVELLRGEALSLADTLSSRGTLHSQIQHFVPNGLDSILSPPADNEEEGEKSTSPTRRKTSHPVSPTLVQTPSQSNSPPEPPALPHLRTLLHVRAQLHRCISQFNLALTLPFPPSLLSPTTTTNTTNPRTSLKPPPSTSTTSPSPSDSSAETKGQAALARVKQEILELIADTEGRGGGVERARERVRELRSVSEIWKGTGEERARARWVDGLEGMVREEEERRVRRGGGGLGQRQGQVRREGSVVRAVETEGRSGTPGFLRRLREEIYME